MDPDELGIGGEAAPIGLGPAPTPGNADPQAAYAYQPPAAPAPPPSPQGQGGGLGGLFSMCGGGSGLGGGQAADATKPGWQQGVIGLGLGLLAGNPFNKWGAALQGYQRGAAADVTRAQQAENVRYHGQELEMRRQALALQRELAYKPQFHFGEYEDPATGLRTPYAVQIDQRTGRATPLSLGVADRLAAQSGGGVTLTDPYDRPYQVPAGVNPRPIREEFAKIRAQIASGVVSVDQGRAQLAATQIGTANEALKKDDLDHQGLSRYGTLREGVGERLGPLGGVLGGVGQSAQGQAYSDHKNTFINGLMARRPGTPRDALDREYFPQPGESSATVEHKRQLREDVVNAIRAEGGPGFRGPPPAQPTQRAQPRKIDRARAKAAGYTDAEIDAYERGR